MRGFGRFIRGCTLGEWSVEVAFFDSLPGIDPVTN